MQPLISVIIPVYNVENYLDQCVQSVVNQTISNWELILIDDGSTDRSGELCDQFARQDPRIQVCHNRNSGPSYSRNVGLTMAQGAYLLFVDSDDYLEPNACEFLLNIAIDKPQIVFFGYYTEAVFRGEDSVQIKNNISDNYYMTNTDFKSQYCNLSRECCVNPVWNKMYSSEFVKKYHAQFPVGVNAAEDLVFNMALYPYVNKVVTRSVPLYHHVNHGNSICSSFNPTRFQSCKKVYAIIEPILKSWNPDFLDEYRNIFIKDLNICINNIYLKNATWNYKQKKGYIHKIVNDPLVQNCLSHTSLSGIRNRITGTLIKHKKVLLLMGLGKITRIIKPA